RPAPRISPSPLLMEKRQVDPRHRTPRHRRPRILGTKRLPHARRPMERTTLRMVTLAVLAGGAGTRMGQPKAWLQYNHQPILNYLLSRWRWPGETLLITSPGREYPPASSRFDRVIIDPIPDQGPLPGVLTALESTRTDLLIIATCDMPPFEKTHL